MSAATVIRFDLQPDVDDGADEIEALRASVTVPEDAAQAALAAFASDLLRAIGVVDLEHAQLVANRDAEIARIRMRYAGQLERLDRRRAVLEGAVGNIVERYDFGRKKTAVVGYGQFGRRAVPEKLAVTDPGALLTWAERHAPDLVRVVEKRDVPHAKVVAHFRETSEVPDGCEYTAAHEDLVIKPELGARELGAEVRRG
jgi:phage host-nuclease inhibitor protein Gam